MHQGTDTGRCVCVCVWKRAETCDITARLICTSTCAPVYGHPSGLVIAATRTPGARNAAACKTAAAIPHTRILPVPNLTLRETDTNMLNITHNYRYQLASSLRALFCSCCLEKGNNRALPNRLTPPPKRQGMIVAEPKLIFSTKTCAKVARRTRRMLGCSLRQCT
eukprot:615050-Amphidinium_carterae.1